MLQNSTSRVNKTASQTLPKIEMRETLPNSICVIISNTHTHTQNLKKTTNTCYEWYRKSSTKYLAS